MNYSMPLKKYIFLIFKINGIKKYRNIKQNKNIHVSVHCKFKNGTVYYDNNIPSVSYVQQDLLQYILIQKENTSSQYMFFHQVRGILDFLIRHDRISEGIYYVSEILLESKVFLI